MDNYQENSSQYDQITQSELLNRLEAVGISVTPQTIRNWEKARLIIPPYRSGQRGGRITEYSEFVLAEVYAIYHLMQGYVIVDNFPLPKLTMMHLALARQLQIGYRPDDYPKPPTDKFIYYTSSDPQKSVIPNMKMVIYDEQTPGYIGDDNLRDAIDDLPNKKRELSHIFINILEKAWRCAIDDGCKQFLYVYHQS